jgi:RNA polymerase sigma factor (sigma-70 family)
MWKLMGKKPVRSEKDKKKDRRCGDHFVDHYTCSLGYHRKKRPRIRYLNWVTGEEELKYFSAVSIGDENNFDSNPQRNLELEKKVREAIDGLEPLEKKFIEYFYFQSWSYQDIGEVLDKKIHKLERIHKQALDKLRIRLKDYVRIRFNLFVPEENKCPICKCPQRKEIEELIKSKKKEETWKRIMKLCRQNYEINITTPQILIGHRKKHMI